MAEAKAANLLFIINTSGGYFAKEARQKPGHGGELFPEGTVAMPCHRPPTNKTPDYRADKGALAMINM